MNHPSITVVIRTPEDCKKALEKLHTLRDYRQYLYSIIDNDSAQIDVRERLDQWNIIKYIKETKELHVEQAQRLYEEIKALRESILAYIDTF